MYTSLGKNVSIISQDDLFDNLPALDLRLGALGGAFLPYMSIVLTVQLPHAQDLGDADRGVSYSDDSGFFNDE